MSKFFQAFLTGSFFTFILDFQLFLGIKFNYLDRYEIKEYYNILFADHQNIFYILPLVIIIGFVTTYINNTKVSLTILVSMFIVTLLVFIPPIGEKIGAAMLQKKDIRYQDSRYIYKGTLYYEGRQSVTIFDDELGRLITLNKKDLHK
jgi:hypothetical protein